jgi:hypothetical protein
MKKKMAIIVFAIFLTVSTQSFAGTWGVGGAFSIDALGGLPQQAMLSLKTPHLPVLWGVGMQLGQDNVNIGMTADWWLHTQKLFNFVNLYVGPGLYAAGPDQFELGGRVPIGLNAYPVSALEIFLEVAPTVLVLSQRDGINIPQFALQGAFGLRFWFNT